MYDIFHWFHNLVTYWYTIERTR